MQAQQRRQVQQSEEAEKGKVTYRLVDDLQALGINVIVKLKQ